MKALLATKIGMTSTIAEDGAVEAITLLLIEPNIITQIKTTENDGYQAVQVGTGKAKLGKAQLGHFKPAKIMPKTAREFRVSEITEDLRVGESLSPEVFSIGDKVAVSGISKGKGWAGTIKRHNFHRGRKTHGGRSYRRPGSIGSMYPQHILKGKKMAGQMGHTRVTTRNLTVALIDTDNQVIGVVGAVPGPRKSTVMIKGAEL